MRDGDEMLVARVQVGDLGAFRELVERYEKRVYHIAYDIVSNHDDAEDISQEAFIHVYRSIGSFRGDSSFYTWLYRIAVNLSLNLRRRVSHRHHYSLEEEILQQADRFSEVTGVLSGDPEEAVRSAEVDLHIHRALGSLSEKQRTVFILRHYHDLSTREVSQIMGCTEGAVKAHLFRAIRKLQKALAFYREEKGH